VYLQDTLLPIELRLVPKVKMRVAEVSINHTCLIDIPNLMWVLSKQVGDESMSEAIQFVRMMDKFFDTFNVNNFTTGKHQLKVFQDPYKANSDFCLTVS